jgi:methionyl-tRNA formyltransferase
MTQQFTFAFFGTPYIAVETLDILLGHNIIPSIIVTAPDQPAGRGLTLTQSPVKTWAIAHNIPFLQPEKLDEEFTFQLSTFNFQLSIVVAYGKILPETLINLPPLGTINIHYSLLPKYRGASPVESVILHGEVETGVTIQNMVFQLDAGDILAIEKTPIGNNETTLELRARLITLGGELLAKSLPNIISGNIQAIPQDNTLATKCGKIQKEDGLIELTGDPEKNYNKYRAYKMWPRTYFFIQTKEGIEKRIIIQGAKFENGIFIPTRVIPEGKKEISYEEFLRNH